MPARPEYLLFTEALRHPSGRFLWRFMLLSADSDQTVTASDLVDETSATRTELLALVRGLEALDQPADVRLFTGSLYLSRGLSRGLAQWRSQHWHWERFGRRVPIRHCDLWQRVDRALEFHTLDCRVWGEPEHTTTALAYPPAENDADADFEPTATDGPDVLVVRRSHRRHGRNRMVAATRSAMGGLRRHVETHLEPAMMPAS